MSERARQPVCGRPYDVIIDRGRLHQIPAPEHSMYVANVAAATGPDARTPLFMRAYRGLGATFADPAETWLHRNFLAKMFAGAFKIHSWRATNLIGVDEPAGARKLPGIVYRLIREAVHTE